MEYDPRFRTTFDQAGIGFALIDSRTGNLIKANKEFCDIVGLEKDVAEGSSFMAIAHPDDVQESLHAMKGLLEGGLGEFTMEKSIHGMMVPWFSVILPLLNYGMLTRNPRIIL